MKSIFLFLNLVIFTTSFAQVGIGTTTPDNSSVLDISSADKGLLIPRIFIGDVTASTPVTSPATGLLIYNTNASILGGNGVGFYFWDGIEWVMLSSNIPWNLSGNSGTNPANNFIGTIDNQDLSIRTNNIENIRVNTDGNVGIGTISNLARLYTYLPNTNTTTRYGYYNYMDGASTSSTYGIYTRNLSSTNSTKYGIYNNVNNEGTGNHYGIMNYTYMNTASNNTGYGGYNYLNSYGTGNHRASYNYLNHSGTAASTQNYASYNLMNIATSTNTSTIYGEYTEVDYSAGPSYGEYKEMNSSAAYTSTMYGDYNHMVGSGNGTSYAVYNDFDNTGTGYRFGIRNEFSDVNGPKYGLYNNFPNGTGAGPIYGVYNNIQNDANATKYGVYNRISGGDGTLRGSYNSIIPATTNTSTIYGVYGSVSSNGTGMHYGGYFNAYGDANRAVYGTNTHTNGWAAYFNGRGYFSSNVGIGNTNPTQARLVVTGVNTDQTLSDHGYLLADGTTGLTNNSPKSYSIWATGRIAATEFNAFSDARVKNIIGRSDSNQDLQTLSQIKITDYTFKDKIAKGNKTHKKLIAQELKAVYPQAVANNTSEIIPNIYELSQIKNGWIALQSNAAKVGDTVKLIFDDTEELTSVTEVNSNAIKTSSNKEGKVFVYGTEIDDFHTVDYQAIAMLNVSATQALLKRIEKLEQDKKMLLQALSKHNEDTNKRLLVIEQLLLNNETANK